MCNKMAVLLGIFIVINYYFVQMTAHLTKVICCCGEKMKSECTLYKLFYHVTPEGSCMSVRKSQTPLKTNCPFNATITWKKSNCRSGKMLRSQPEDVNVCDGQVFPPCFSIYL